jgi:hypothetical protein
MKATPAVRTYLGKIGIKTENEMLIKMLDKLLLVPPIHFIRYPTFLYKI